jgi:hypothetical protein
MNRAQRVIAFLEQRPRQWIRATEFEPIGGRQAWRTAISEARQIVEARGGKIENRVRSVGMDQDGMCWTLSEYRYLPVPVSLLDMVS